MTPIDTTAERSHLEQLQFNDALDVGLLAVSLHRAASRYLDEIDRLRATIDALFYNLDLAEERHETNQLRQDLAAFKKARIVEEQS